MEREKTVYQLELTSAEVFLLETGLLELRQQTMGGKLIPYFLKEDPRYLRYCAIEQLLQKLARLRSPSRSTIGHRVQASSKNGRPVGDPIGLPFVRQTY